MKTVNYILQAKRAEVYSVVGNTSVFDALNIMMEKNISALLVIENEQLLGIFTERDYARKIILVGRSSKETLVREAMTANPQVIGPIDSIDHCMELMTERHFRHLPVMDGGKVVGMISIGDVVKSIIEYQKETIHHLQSYISS